MNRKVDDETTRPEQGEKQDLSEEENTFITTLMGRV
jgi:hypothetical protein